MTALGKMQNPGPGLRIRTMTAPTMAMTSFMTLRRGPNRVSCLSQPRCPAL